MAVSRGVVGEEGGKLLAIKSRLSIHLSYIYFTSKYCNKSSLQLRIRKERRQERRVRGRGREREKERMNGSLDPR